MKSTIQWEIKWEDPAMILMYEWRNVTTATRKRMYECAQSALHIYYGALRMGDFFACLRGDFSVIGIDGSENWECVTNAQYVWSMGFVEYSKTFAKMMQRYMTPSTPEQTAARAACVRLSLEEGLLVFLRDYYGLQSMTAAENLTVNEFVIAKKDTYNKAVYEYQLRKIMDMKQKQKQSAR